MLYKDVKVLECEKMISQTKPLIDLLDQVKQAQRGDPETRQAKKANLQDLPQQIAELAREKVLAHLRVLLQLRNNAKDEMMQQIYIDRARNMYHVALDQPDHWEAAARRYAEELATGAMQDLYIGHYDHVSKMTGPGRQKKMPKPRNGPKWKPSWDYLKPKTEQKPEQKPKQSKVKKEKNNVSETENNS